MRRSRAGEGRGAKRALGLAVPGFFVVGEWEGGGFFSTGKQ